MNGHVRHDVGKVEEEGFFLVFLNELDAALRELPGEPVLVRVVFGDVLVLEPRNGRNAMDGGMIGAVVVGIGESREVVETMAGGAKFGLEAEMPFAEAGG